MQDIKELLQVMNHHDASDVYITADSAPAYRINGVVRPLGPNSLTQAETAYLALSILNDDQKDEFLKANELNLAYYHEQLGRYRVNIFRQKGAVGMVIRKINTIIPDLEDLELPEVLQEIVMRKRGLVLMVGATGSGKSTSLAAMIGYRNQNEPGHIISVEDPIEFVHTHRKSIVTQREIGVDTVDYPTALKNTLRQAPDVILIGEIRDTVTMESAITFAETGHLCLSTLHANNANQAMERVMNFFPEERHKQIHLQLSLNMVAIISQRLVKKRDGGRVAAIEILMDSPWVKDLIHQGEVDLLKEAMHKGSGMGMQTFDMHLFELYKQGIITEEEALRNSDSENNLRIMIKVDREGGDLTKKQTKVSVKTKSGEEKKTRLRFQS